VKHAKADRIDKLGGMFRKMPLVMAGFAVGALAMIGVPPTCGFFSKWYLIRGGIESGHWNYVVALILSSLINAVLFFRIFEIAYFGKDPKESHGSGHDSTEEGAIGDSTGLARIPAGLFTRSALLITAALVILLGIFNGEIVELIQQSIRDLPVVGLK
jgi:multicomponent Na+:H+ antiporter subunit D